MMPGDPLPRLRLGLPVVQHLVTGGLSASSARPTAACRYPPPAVGSTTRTSHTPPVAALPVADRGTSLDCAPIGLMSGGQAFAGSAGCQRGVVDGAGHGECPSLPRTLPIIRPRPLMFKSVRIIRLRGDIKRFFCSLLSAVVSCYALSRRQRGFESRRGRQQFQQITTLL